MSMLHRCYGMDMGQIDNERSDRSHGKANGSDWQSARFTKLLWAYMGTELFDFI